MKYSILLSSENEEHGGTAISNGEMNDNEISTVLGNSVNERDEMKTEKESKEYEPNRDSGSTIDDNSPLFLEIEAYYFERHDFELREEKNQRSYGNDESILVYEVKTNRCVSEIYDSLKVSYGHPIAKSFHSLQSALTDGCDFAHLGDTISFSGKPHLQKEEMVFILPLINHTDTYNTIPETIYFHCISGVKDATIGILSPLEENKVITVFCRSNVLIFHSTEEYVKVIMIKRSDIEEWEYIESKAYRYVETMKEDPPFIRETNQTQIRNQIVEDVIQYNIPVVIEGVTSSGKTFTVEQAVLSFPL